MLHQIEIAGFKSFPKKTRLVFDVPIAAVVGPNGSGKSNVSDAIRWALGEQSLKSLRGKRGEDFIFNGSKDIPKMNRACVGLTFDNAERRFQIDFEKVEMKREVYRDGQNLYSLNGSQVRLKDILGHLGYVGIGSSSHHMIGQGEADRILNAHARDRRNMVEESLGLKVYEYQILESRRKLEKTEENIRKAVALRLELSSHLEYLERQVALMEKTEKMRQELLNLYSAYLPAELGCIEDEKQKIAKEHDMAIRKLEEVRGEISALEVFLFDDRTRSGGEVKRCPACKQEVRQKLELKEELRHYAELQDKKADLQSKLAELSACDERVRIAAQELHDECAEGEALLGYIFKELWDAILNERAHKMPEASGREEMQKKIKKLKIKLEESEGGSYETAREYDEIKKRDEFLSHELADLERTKSSLQDVMKELSLKIELQFESGLEKINEEFQKFFELMFGGGHAALLPEDEVEMSDDDGAMNGIPPWLYGTENNGRGLDIEVALPYKRVKGLHVLSGGERALTSIALLFALTQVNPPPFLVLDETDAALDESNSRRYGEMLESLSKQSQLVVITHNRETMAHAGVLYGVTMGPDGASRVLSVRLSDV